ncbi:MAG TPA: DUF748 domain-containing protein [Candidatus Didemnitutus sp.]|nr:DUF748 domain-containing protein [Candidatus Didemnitutus sp.]
MTLRRRRAGTKKSRWFLWLLGILAVLMLVAWLVVPPIARSQAEKQLTAALHRPVTIGRLSINPIALTATIEDFAIHEPKGKEIFLGWDRLFVNFELISLFRKKWKFSEIDLDGPHALVVRNADGSLNFSDLLTNTPPAPTKGAPAPTALRPLVITRFKLTNARLEFVDRSRRQNFATRLGPVGFTVSDFHTVGSEQSPYSFEAVTELGEKFSWHGWVESTPFRSGGDFGVTGLVLKKYTPYYADRTGVDLVDGRLTVSGKYLVSFDAANQAMKLFDGAVKVRNIKLVERGSGESLFELPAGDVTGITADGTTLSAGVKSVVLDQGRVRVRREKDGSLNLMQLLPPNVAAPSSTAAESESPRAALPSIKIDDVLVSGWNIEAEDLAAPSPAHFGLSEVGAHLKNVTLADGATLPFEVALRWQPQGTVRALGSVVLKPLKVGFKVDIDSLGLLPLSPYLERFVNVRLADGVLSVKGDGTAALPESGPPQVTFAGNAWLERFSLLDTAHVEELAGFSDLIVSGMKVATAPEMSASIEEVNLNGPYARVDLDRDGKLNLASLIPPAPAKPAAETQPALAAPAPKIEVARVVLNGGDFSLRDQSISPAVRLGMTSFGGTLTGLSSENPGRGEADLKATLTGGTAMTIKGRFDPLAKNIFVDAKVGLDGFDLVPFSPYSGKYAGYELARGKLFVDVTAKVADRKIDMANVVTLNQFTFGRATNSPDATKLPVRFGVALLKDLDGKIVLDVPVDGSLDDPDFRIGRVVWRVIGNLLTKAVASPFSMLGAMFGGGGEELSFQEFNGGESTLTPDGLKKLDTLTKALTQRPGLNLNLEGSYDAAVDTDVLRQAKFVEQVRRAIWESRHAIDPNIPPPEQIEISPADTNAMIKRLFDQKFPPGSELGTPLPPPPQVAPPAPPSGNLLQRVIDFVTLKRPRELGAYRVAQQKAQKDYVKELKSAADTGLPVDEMTARLLTTVTVTPEDLQALADARVQRVRDYLANEGHIAPERLFVTKPQDDTAAANPNGKGARVFLKLE